MKWFGKPASGSSRYHRSSSANDGDGGGSGTICRAGLLRQAPTARTSALFAPMPLRWRCWKLASCGCSALPAGAAIVLGSTLSYANRISDLLTVFLRFQPANTRPKGFADIPRTARQWGLLLWMPMVLLLVRTVSKAILSSTREFTQAGNNQPARTNELTPRSRQRAQRNRNHSA